MGAFLTTTTKFNIMNSQKTKLTQKKKEINLSIEQMKNNLMEYR